MSGDDDLLLLDGSAGHLFVTERAQLECVSWHCELAACRVIDAGGHVLERALDAAGASRAISAHCTTLPTSTL